MDFITIRSLPKMVLLKWALNVSSFLQQSHTVEWTKFGGIAGRGVLLDYVAYAQRHGIKYNAYDRFTISVADLDTMVAEQKVQLKVGDILLIRSGYVKWHDESTDQERVEGSKNIVFGGVESTMDAVEWIWNHHFSAVAGDSPSWEAMPPRGGFYLVPPLYFCATNAY